MEDKDYGAGIWALNKDGVTSGEVGLLSFKEEEGIYLDIPYGSLDRGDLLHSQLAQSSYESVHGFLKTGEIVCLTDVYSNGASLSMPGGISQKYYCQTAYLSKSDFDVSASIKKVKIKLKNLRDWYGKAPYYATYMANEDGKLSGDIVYTHERSFDKGFYFKLPHLTISLDHDGRASAVSPSGFSVSHDCFLVVEFQVGAQLEEVDAIISKIVSFFSFCFDEYAAIESTHFMFVEKNTWVESIVPYLTASTNKQTKKSSDMLLPFSHFEDDLGSLRTVIERWLQFNGDIDRAVSLMTSMKANWRIPIDLDFLVQAQALEALSRVDADENELSKAELRRRRKLVKTCLPGKFGEWIYDKLNNAGRKSANDLMKELFERVGTYIDELIPDKTRFVRDHRISRDFYTHRGSSSRREPLTGISLHYHNLGVTLIFQAGVLIHLGYSPSEVQEIMNRDNKIKRKAYEVTKAYGVAGSEASSSSEHGTQNVPEALPQNNH